MKSFVLPAIFLLLLTIIFISTRAPNWQRDSEHAIKGDYHFKNVTIKLLKSGKKEWELTASESTIYGKQFYLVDVMGRYQNQSEDSLMTFSSPTGVYNTHSGQLNLVQTASQIHVLNSTYHMLAEEIQFNGNAQQFSAHGNIQIKSDQIDLSAQQLIGDFIKNKLYFSYDVKGSIVGYTTH